MGRARELAELAASYDSGNIFGMKNRIINGDMRIDQRNAGASVTLTSSFTSASFAVDRWRACRGASNTATAQRSTVAPAGFTNSLLYTVGTGASPAAADFGAIQQLIEGFNIGDFGWGAAGAQPITLSFRARSSLTGTFGIVITNSAQSLAYATTYTISSANTFELKTITIPGPTTATWLTDNGVGLQVAFDMGVGSNQSTAASTSWQSGNFLGVTGVTKPLSTAGATFYITGVQLEKGSTATSFDYRDYGRELILCQRYYEVGGATSYNNQASSVLGVPYKVTKRATPTWTALGNFYAGAEATGRAFGGGGTSGTQAFYIESTSSYAGAVWAATAEL